MKTSLIIAALLVCLSSIALGETFDIVTYAPPKGWKKETAAGLVSYVTQNKKSGTVCRITVYRSTPYTGDLDTNFSNAWSELAATRFNIPQAPDATPLGEVDGWTVKSGAYSFPVDAKEALVTLTTFTNQTTSLSVLSETDSKGYLPAIRNFVGSMKLRPANGNANAPANPAPAGPSGFQFISVTYDDGWISTVQQDWVAVTKGNLTVLLHYPKEGTIFPADPEPLIRAAWNILVAPRYSNLRDFTVAPSLNFEWNRGYIAAATATDNATGQEKYVVLFRRSDGWLEFIAPDQPTFQQEFKVDVGAITFHSSSDIWPPLDNMSGYNKFPVAASDLRGTWEDGFSSTAFVYHANSGGFAGSQTTASFRQFIFGPTQTYHWSIIATNSSAGQTHVARAKSSGSFRMLNNWQAHFSDLEGQPKTYDVYFSATKGGRILWMRDAEYPAMGNWAFARTK